MYVCMYIYVHIYMYIYIYTCIYKNVFVCVCVCVCGAWQGPISMYSDAWTNVYANNAIHNFTCVCIYIRIHIYINTYPFAETYKLHTWNLNQCRFSVLFLQRDIIEGGLYRHLYNISFKEKNTKSALLQAPCIQFIDTV